ncbi:MAG: hypothetical protein JW969_15420, partial [Spirochaetales bacterium]|nr:hypothetical protein [Spirochaetales bacterium]
KGTDCIDEAGFKIFIREITVNNLKGRNIQFVFNIMQNGEWLENLKLSLDPEEVLYDDSVWQCSIEKDEWLFCYPYSQLAAAGNTQQAFTGYMMVMDADTNKVLSRERVTINIDDVYTDQDADYNEWDELEEEDMTYRGNYQDIIIEWREATEGSLKIENGILYHTYAVESSGGMSVSANIEYQYVTREYPLSESDIKKVLDIIENSNWAKLEKSYGVSPDERFYPETIHVKNSSGDKTVTYRSGQAGGTPRPKEFNLIHKALKDLLDSYK